MTATKSRLRESVNARRTWARWIVPAGGLVLLPKCVACWIAYAALMLGMRPELCGEASEATGALRWSMLAVTLTSGMASILAFRALRRSRADVPPS